MSAEPAAEPRIAHRTTPRRSRGPLALALAVLVLAPAIIPMGAGDASATAAGLPAGGMEAPSASWDYPGKPYGYPDENTFGYTTKAPDLDRWVYDRGGRREALDPPSPGVVAVTVDMGKFARKHLTSGPDYWMDIELSLDYRMWSNGNGAYDPARRCDPEVWLPFLQDVGIGLGLREATPWVPYHSVCNDGGDDAWNCDPFPVFDVYVVTPANTKLKLRTVEGRFQDLLAGGKCPTYEPGPRSCPPWIPQALCDPLQLLPDPAYHGEKPTRFHIPASILGQSAMIPNLVAVPEGSDRQECNLTILIEPRDLTLPAYHKDHDKALDGIAIKVHSVQVELVAPPLVISHGWTPDRDPPKSEVKEWQPILKQNLMEEMEAHLGQNPWAWARNVPAPHSFAIYLNAYDPKGDFRASAGNMPSVVAALRAAAGYHPSGKVWMHGHSMGGIMSRWYIEQLGGHLQVEKLAQTATPNTGAVEAHLYTKIRSRLYAAGDNSWLGVYIIGNNVCSTTFLHVGWKEWWYDNIHGYRHACVDGQHGTHGRVMIADHLLKGAGPRNPTLEEMNEHERVLRASGVLPPYFTVRANSYYFPLSDVVVSLWSASLNGRIPSRTLWAPHDAFIDVDWSVHWLFHENIPEFKATARYLARYYAGLDLDDGKPRFCGTAPQAPRNPGDLVNPAGNSTSNDPDLDDNMTEEWTGDLPRGRGFDFLVDGTRLRVAVRTAVSSDAGPVAATLRSPSGATHIPSQRVTGWNDIALFDIPQPAAGRWRLELTPGTPGTTVHWRAEVASPVRLRVSTDLPLYTPSQPVTIRAAVSDGLLPVPGLTGHAEVPGPQGPRQLALHDDGLHNDGLAGDGTYGAIWMPDTTFPGPLSTGGQLDIPVRIGSPSFQRAGNAAVRIEGLQAPVALPPLPADGRLGVAGTIAAAQAVAPGAAPMRLVDPSPRLGPMASATADPGWSREPNTYGDRYPGAQHGTCGDGTATHNGWCNRYDGYRSAFLGWADAQAVRVAGQLSEGSSPGLRGGGDHRRSLAAGTYAIQGYAGLWKDQPQSWVEHLPLPDTMVINRGYTRPPDGWIGNVVNATGTYYAAGYQDEACTIDGAQQVYTYAQCHPYLDGWLPDPQQAGQADHGEWRGECVPGRVEDRVLTLVPEGGTFTFPIFVARNVHEGADINRFEDWAGFSRPLHLGMGCVGTDGLHRSVDHVILPVGNVGQRLTTTWTVLGLGPGAGIVHDEDVYEAHG